MACINSIATAVPDHDIHRKFVTYAPGRLPDDKSRLLFRRLSERSHIEHRYSVLAPHPDKDFLDDGLLYRRGHSPGTGQRMRVYQEHAFSLARRALDQLDLRKVTHLIVTTCTGFYAPGLDIDIVRHYGLDPAAERTVIGFMGCHAAFNALKMARHIVLSQAGARVLIVNLELCTLHLNPNGTLEDMISFLLFADGCAASIVSSEPCGLRLGSFGTTLIKDSAERIQWTIGSRGFGMTLCGKVPSVIAVSLPAGLGQHLNDGERQNIRHWAVHPGGRAILDAVRDGGNVPEEQLATSRDILRRFGNMSSATIMFVLNEILRAGTPGEGMALGFGPGMTMESMRFFAGETA
jgi:predicted naringenin-chalcone synthase